ncbi:sensor histidine kinase [Allosediminivita pacifica]|uniref:histidine kinase n=1 Tax=Allosediminivita pacifica TaxID=1267769 RepID=A0A2T6AUH5_9RHOB|nr:ATP-binding protein [Allosediminivita pacifica]PTX47472.1 hypothetical protein C8N44_11296 [Allosediminivita pacifica]GGB14456.1 hypothetical protein GCM10011324_25820 [Allosediminivita pacifica]
MTKIRSNRLGTASLRARMVALAVLISALSVICLGAASYLMTRDVEQRHLELELERRLDRIRAQFDAEMTRILQEMILLANVPPVQGLARTLSGDPVDPADGSSTAADWKSRLAAIFTSVHEVRPEYVQLRLIGLTDGGRELVRVDKRGSTIVRIPEAELQQKAGRDYVRVGARLAPGEIHVTSVEWNRENGRVTDPRIAVIRYVLPVFDADGKRFGMVVINVSAGHMIQKITRSVPPGRTVLLLDGNGGGFIQEPGGRGTQILIDRLPPFSPSILEAIEHASATPQIRHADGKILAATTLDRVRPGGSTLHLALMTDAREFAIGARRTSTIILLAGIATTLVAAGLAHLVTNRQLRPLLALNSEIRAAEAAMRRPDLPRDRADEIGQLARSFGRLLARISEQNQPARTVFDEVRDSVLVIGADNTIEDANQAATRLFGRPRDDLVGTSFCTLLVNTGRPPAACESCAGRFGPCQGTIDGAHRNSSFFELEAIRRNGEHFPMEISASTIETGGRKRRICIMRDITDRKAEEAERAKLIADLQASNSELDTFAYVASHDLKAPLRVIHNAADWIEEDLDGTPNEEMLENLEILRSRADRMQKLLDALFEHARIGRKRGDTPSELVTGADLEEELRTLLTVPDGFELTFDEGFRGLRICRLPLQLVLLNVISNALKHHDLDQGCVRVEARVSGTMAEVRVTDDGPGIDPAYHDRIFGMFQTLRARDEIEGSGMGLAIARKHVKLAGGEITVRSVAGERGTCFVIILPLAEDAARPAAA